jgi:diguanylate cyclase
MEQLKKLDYSTYLLSLAIPKMAKLHIPVTPENYAIWYEYFAETNLNLKRAIDGLLANNVTFTKQVNQGLYNNFIQEQSPEIIQNVQIETQILIKSLFNKIHKMTDETTDFSTSLSEYNQKLKEKPSLKLLNEIIINISAEVDVVIKNNGEMKSNLHTLDYELSRLKDEIDSLNKVAMTDELTSLNNRRAYEIFAMEQVAKFNQTQTLCSLLLADIDNFKHFNDTYGHLVGDKVLAYVAMSLKQGIKGSDFVARYGGEEFVILLPDTNKQDAITLANNLRELVSHKQLTIGKEKKQQLGKVTVSVGVATIEIGDDADTFLSRADQQLYLAKGAGRDCVKG